MSPPGSSLLGRRSHGELGSLVVAHAPSRSLLLRGPPGIFPRRARLCVRREKVGAFRVEAPARGSALPREAELLIPRVRPVRRGWRVRRQRPACCQVRAPPPGLGDGDVTRRPRGGGLLVLREYVPRARGLERVRGAAGEDRRARPQVRANHARVGDGSGGNDARRSAERVASDVRSRLFFFICVFPCVFQELPLRRPRLLQVRDGRITARHPPPSQAAQGRLRWPPLLPLLFRSVRNLPPSPITSYVHASDACGPEDSVHVPVSYTHLTLPTILLV